jgi:hypothetical protein
VRRIIDSGIAKLSNYLPAEDHHFRTLSYEATQFWAAILSFNTPYRGLLRLLTARDPALFQGHGHCGRLLAVTPCSIRLQDQQLRRPKCPVLNCG